MVCHSGTSSVSLRALRSADRGTYSTISEPLVLKATAEGVETTAQLDRLKGMGCDLAQGNLFSEPLDAEAIERFLGEG
jgi:EAL domain-containing protein (putative c-di-GMP-specific phosphodiesterase class I)